MKVEEYRVALVGMSCPELEKLRKAVKQEQARRKALKEALEASLEASRHINT